MLATSNNNVAADDTPRQIDGMQSTSHEDDFSIKDKLPPCSCGRDKVSYICNKTTCPNNVSQSLYCYFCSQDDENKHDHGLTSIFKGIEGLKKQWYDFNQSLNETVQATAALVRDYGNLLEVLDRQLIEVFKNFDEKLIFRDC